MFHNSKHPFLLLAFGFSLLSTLIISGVYTLPGIAFSIDAASIDAESNNNASIAAYQESTPDSTATPVPEPAIAPSPTVRVRPTPTPLAIPPPTNPGTRRLMVGFGILIVLVVIFGILINRNRIFQRF